MTGIMQLKRLFGGNMKSLDTILDILKIEYGMEEPTIIEIYNENGINLSNTTHPVNTASDEIKAKYEGYPLNNKMYLIFDGSLYNVSDVIESYLDEDPDITFNVTLTLCKINDFNYEVSLIRNRPSVYSILATNTLTYNGTPDGSPDFRLLAFGNNRDQDYEEVGGEWYRDLMNYCSINMDTSGETYIKILNTDTQYTISEFVVEYDIPQDN